MSSFAMISHVLRSQFSHLPYPDYSFSGQTIIVTGANIGLGFEAAFHYVRLGAEKVIIAVRNLDKGQQAKTQIEERTGKGNVVEVWQLDLSSYESVRGFVKKAESLKRIDVLLENAGMATGSWRIAEGSEVTITVNVYGTFLLALLMFPLLQQSGRRHNMLPRLTIVSSDTHHYADFKEGKQEDIVAALDDKKFFQPDEGRYAVSKLIEVYFVREFCSKVDPQSTGVVVNLVNPGLCWSDLGKEASWSYAIVLHIMRTLLARSTEVGSRTLVFATTGGSDSHGMYSGDCTFNDRAISRFVRSEEGKKMQKKVYDQVSRKLESIHPGIFNNIPMS